MDVSDSDWKRGTLTFTNELMIDYQDDKDLSILLSGINFLQTWSSQEIHQVMRCTDGKRNCYSGYIKALASFTVHGFVAEKDRFGVSGEFVVDVSPEQTVEFPDASWVYKVSKGFLAMEKKVFTVPFKALLSTYLRPLNHAINFVVSYSHLFFLW